MKDYDLEKAANEYANSIPQHDHNKVFSIVDFKAGANWRYEQFENNRLAACDNMTKEEFDREQEFTTDFIEKNNRVPTYSDAIEYGRKQMIDKACEWLEDNKDNPFIGCEDPCLSGYLTDQFIADFRNYMKGG